MNEKIYVVMPKEYAKMMEKFLEKIKEQEIVTNYFHNKEEREFVVHLNSDAKIPGDKEDLISAYPTSEGPDAGELIILIKGSVYQIKKYLKM